MDLFERAKQRETQAGRAQPTSDAPNTGGAQADESVATPVDEGTVDLRAPLAERMRPRTLDELAGHQAKLGPKTALGRAILGDRAPSMILWGPPGVGKTTVARVVAAHSRAHFAPLSAVLSGVNELRVAVARAEAERRAGRRTVLFVDEIHRFNKSQQDALLPHVEAGTVLLLGATTENPSFALVGALLSRCQVVRLDPLSDEAVTEVLTRALGDRARGLGALDLEAEAGALAAIASHVDGDARRALGLLDFVASEAHAAGEARITLARVGEAGRERALRYDRDGEEHYNLSSALIKSLRGSDPDAALYWCVRMIESGDDPLFVLRRLLIFAAEDVGLADPKALELVVAADHAFQRVGLPEGMIPIAHAVTYLAVAPKSKSAYNALRAVQAEIARSGALPVPMRLRNAPTKAMKAWGYGEGYRDPQRTDEGFVEERYLPEALGDRVFYEPTQRGVEARIAERLRVLRERAQPRLERDRDE